MKTALVITTINKLNQNIIKFSSGCKKKNWDLIIIGDKKTPKNYYLKYGNYLNLIDQKKLNFNFSKICPINNYARKNIGYLYALKMCNNVIVETDDDNFPKKNFFSNRIKIHKSKEIKNKSWVNIYDLFLYNSENIWPRGLPLDQIKKTKIRINKLTKFNEFNLQQGLADQNPDVDAIYRLIHENINIKFKKNYKICLGRSYSPINSQNTTWFKEISPLMYLPVTCSMRCTDIIRGYVALNILIKKNKKILFHGANLIQNRNVHNLFNDFDQESILYLKSKKIFEKLNKLNIKSNNSNLYKYLENSYKLLIRLRIVKKIELKYLRAWIKDIKIRLR